MEAETQMIYLDTHVIVWLYAGLIHLIPKKTQLVLEKEDLFVSPIVSLEIQYLYETGRIKEEAKNILPDLQTRIHLQICPQSFESVAEQSLRESWTRDPFDRMITAQARLKNQRLLTKDKLIQRHYSKSFWGSFSESV